MKIYRGCQIKYSNALKHYSITYKQDGHMIKSCLALSTVRACHTAIDSFLQRNLVEPITIPKKEELVMRKVMNAKTKDIYNNIYHAKKEMGMSLSWCYNQLGKSKRSRKLLVYAD